MIAIALVSVINHYPIRGLYFFEKPSIYGLVWFSLDGFYGISTIVGYLMLNPLYTYTLNI